MGKYINGIGTSFEAKCANLKELHDAVETDASFKEDLVCVVDNGPFAAAGYAFDEQEFNDFNDPNDLRPKKWFVVPNAASLAK